MEINDAARSGSHPSIDDCDFARFISFVPGRFLSPPTARGRPGRQIVLKSARCCPFCQGAVTRHPRTHQTSPPDAVRADLVLAHEAAVGLLQRWLVLGAEATDEPLVRAARIVGMLELSLVADIPAGPAADLRCLYGYCRSRLEEAAAQGDRRAFVESVVRVLLSLHQPRERSVTSSGVYPAVTIGSSKAATG